MYYVTVHSKICAYQLSGASALLGIKEHDFRDILGNFPCSSNKWNVT